MPPALFLSGLALSVTFGDTSFPSLSPAVTFLPGRGESVPERGKSVKGRGLGKEMKFAWTAKGSPFGRIGKADRH